MIENLIRISPSITYWAAWLSIASTAALFILFAGVGFMGPVNDFLSIFQFLALFPAVFALRQILGAGNPAIINLVTVLALLAMATIIFFQTGLVLGFFTFQQTLRPILAVGVLIGIWWMTVGFIGLSGNSFPAGLDWLAILSGFFYILIAVGFWISGSPEHPLAAIGFLVAAVTVPWWLFWLSRLLPNHV